MELFLFMYVLGGGRSYFSADKGKLKIKRKIAADM